MQKFKTRHDIQAVYAMTSDYFFNFILLHHQIWVEEECKERKRTFWRRLRKNTKTNKQTNNNNKTTSKQQQNR